MLHEGRPGRRAFLKSAAALGAAAALGERAFCASAPSKAVLVSMLPGERSYLERFRIALDAGFAGVEMRTLQDPKEADAVEDASQRSGLRVHSVMNADHWSFPLSSGDRAVVDRSVLGMETSLRNAKLWGADAVLLVPAVVDARTSYRDAWTRSQRVIRERILPLAQELRVVVAVEEVWNKFLLSPLEFARYVDELDSPWAKAYFDVGNVVFYGHPQDWIRTLGARIAKLHLKDFQLDRPAGRFYWRNLGEGDVDWPEVRRALREIGYEGWMTVELSAGDAAYLGDVARRVDRFLVGEAPVAAGSAAASASAGWTSLFDGGATGAWRGYNRSGFPSEAWVVEGGELRSLPNVEDAPDLVTRQRFADFELELEWKLAPGANSGVLYRVVEQQVPSWHSGPEMQIIDDTGHPGVVPLNSTGALYDLVAPNDKKRLLGAGEWNAGRIVMKGSHVEHWLNGAKVVDCDLDSPALRERIVGSKFKDMTRFATEREGLIALQHHGDAVSFRAIRVRPL